MTEQGMYVKWQIGSGIKAGDTVKVLRKARSYEMGWGNGWSCFMDNSVGKERVVMEVLPDRIQLDDGFSYPYFVLELVKKGSRKIKNGDVLYFPAVPKSEYLYIAGLNELVYIAGGRFEFTRSNYSEAVVNGWLEVGTASLQRNLFTREDYIK